MIRVYSKIHQDKIKFQKMKGFKIINNNYNLMIDNKKIKMKNSN